MRSSAATLGDHHVVSLALPEFHGPQFSRVIRFHDIYKRALLADLRGLIRNQHRSLFGRQYELDVNKLPRPEVTIGIAKRGPQIHRAAAVLHGVIEKFDAPNSRAFSGSDGRRTPPSTSRSTSASARPADRSP